VRGPLAPATLARLRDAMLTLAADTLSGPGGLAAALRTTLLDGPAAAPSVHLTIPHPLDTADADSVISSSLRRAAAKRHRHCAFPGCRERAADCHMHHLIRRADGGPTVLSNIVPLCPFHHLIVIHRWGWRLRLNADGTTIATSPDGRILRSHGPPRPDMPPSRASPPGPAAPPGPAPPTRRAA